MKLQNNTPFIANIEALLVECAELIAYNGTVVQSTPEYIKFERNIESFVIEYNLLYTPEWRNISPYLLKKQNQYLTNDEMREIIISLLGLKNYHPQKSLYFDRVFISHSSEDIKYVQPFVELLKFLGLNTSNLFCSSIHEYGIPLGINIYEYLKHEFVNKNIFVIMMLSSNYYSSKPCLNEMGATWVMSKEYLSILLDGFEFSQIEGSIDPQKIGFKITDISRLDEFKDKIIEGLKLKTPNDEDWIRIRDRFIDIISH
jgi:hypothetical protein